MQPRPHAERHPARMGGSPTTPPTLRRSTMKHRLPPKKRRAASVSYRLQPKILEISSKSQNENIFSNSETLPVTPFLLVSLESSADNTASCCGARSLPYNSGCIIWDGVYFGTPYFFGYHTRRRPAGSPSPLGRPKLSTTHREQGSLRPRPPDEPDDIQPTWPVAGVE
jgi:hypothetical protein